ncbi:MAG: sodium:solute symporter family protein [Planctomycetaceae bacterium]
MIYLVCIVAYLILLGGIAVWKTGAVQTQSDFAVAGRSLSPWMMVCTMLAVWIGTGSIVGNAEQTYESGMAAMLLPIGTLAGMLLLSLIATRVRSIEASTVPEIIEQRFGPVARSLAMISLVIAYMVIVSYQFNAGGAVLEVIVGNKPGVPVTVGDRVLAAQLTKGYIQYRSDADWSGNVRFTVQSETDNGPGHTLQLCVIRSADRLTAEQSANLPTGQETTVVVQQGTRTALKFDSKSLTEPSFSVTEIPAKGAVEVVEPVLTARHATMIAAAFIISYAALAGLMSLAWMDLVTGSVIMLTMLIAFPIYWFQAGGWSGIEAAFVSDGRSSHLSPWGVYSPVQLVNYILPVFLLVLGDANQYQRIFASRSAKGARTAMTMMIFIAFAIELLIIACAWIASSMTPDPENGKYILIHAARHFLSLPLGCLFMVTVVAIIISTANSFLHVPATSVVNDLYLPYIKPDASQKHLIRVSRLLVVLFGVVAFVVTLVFSESTGFFRKALYAFTIYGASITPTLVAGLLWRSATRQGAIASICCGAIVTLVWNEVDAVRDSLPAGLAELDAVLPAISLSVTMLVAVSLMTRPSEAGRIINTQQSEGKSHA